ncbi:Chromosome III, complete sequence, related, partial [Eimeria tenella]
VRAVPWWDQRRPFSDSAAVKETLGALHSLVDRCNKLELKYRQLQGRFHQAHLVSLRTPLGSVVSEHLADLEDPSEAETAEIVSFCALDHHLDARTRCWANSQQDTEMRLDLVRRALEAKVKKLQGEIRALRAIEEDPRASAAAAAAAAAAASAGPPPHPAAPLGINQEEPEDIYAGPPTTFG